MAKEKELHELTFDEMVKRGVQMELDAIVKGESLYSRTFSVMELAVRWRSYVTEHNRKEQAKREMLIRSVDAAPAAEKEAK